MEKSPTCMISIRDNIAVPIAEIVFTNNGNFHKSFIDISKVNVDAYVEESIETIRKRRSFRMVTPISLPCVICD